MAILKKLSIAVASFAILFSGIANAAPKAKPVAKESPGVALYNAKKFKEAEPLLIKECNANKSLSCFNLGLIYENGFDKIKIDGVLAVEFYEKACTLGNADSCGTMADLYAWGDYIVSVNEELAANYYEKSCNLDNATGVNCTLAGDAYFLNETLPQDFQKAKTYYEKGCAKKDGLGCSYLAEMYLFGDFGNVDYSNAGKYYKIACDLKIYKSCFELGLMHEKGEGRAIDKDAAFDLYQLACDNKFYDACTGIGNVFFNGTPKHPINHANAMSYFKMACDGKNADGCYNAAYMHFTGNGVAKNLVLAKEFLFSATSINPKHELANKMLKQIP